MIIPPNQQIGGKAKHGLWSEYIEPIEPNEVDEILDRLNQLAGAELAREDHFDV